MATKVFVGNLSFKILPEKLREEFSAAGNVVSANIITRGPRSLGYGFVEFATREEAEKSVTLLNHKDIDGRQINVEVAKPRADLPEKEKRPDNSGNNSPNTQEGGQRPRRPRRPKNTNTNAGGNNTNVQGGAQGSFAPRRGPQGGNQGQAGAPRRMYKPRYQNQDNAGGLAPEGQGNKPVRNFNNNNYNNTNNHNFTNDDNTGETNNRGFRRRRRNNPNRGPRQDQQQVPQQGGNQEQPQTFRPRKPQRKQQERITSPTTLFVANLPFSVDDKELAEIFSAKWKVASAHVVKKRNTRSKGFGFVEFENEADQQAALKEFDGFTLHERVLNVKVALTAVPGAEGEGEKAGAEKPAAEGAEKVEGEKGAAAPAAAAEPKTEAKEVKAEAPAAAEGAEEKKGQ